VRQFSESFHDNISVLNSDIVLFSIVYKGHASTSQKALVISTLTALYIALAAMDLINWYSVTIFTASGYSDQLSIMTDILEDTSFILSDWLMVRFSTANNLSQT